MKNIKTFTQTAGAAVGDFVAKMDEKERIRIGALFQAGNALSLSYVIQPDGASAVLFEALLADGTRRTLGHLSVDAPKIQ